jgi:hypothetical protein
MHARNWSRTRYVCLFVRWDRIRVQENRIPTHWFRLLKLLPLLMLCPSQHFFRFEVLTAEMQKYLSSGIRIFQTTRRHITKEKSFSVFYLSWHLWIRERTAGGRPHTLYRLYGCRKKAGPVFTSWQTSQNSAAWSHLPSPVPRGRFREFNLCRFIGFLKRALYFYMYGYRWFSLSCLPHRAVSTVAAARAISPDKYLWPRSELYCVIRSVNSSSVSHDKTCSVNAYFSQSHP